MARDVIAFVERWPHLACVRRFLRLFVLFQRAFWSALTGRISGKSPWRSLPFQVDVIVRFLRFDWEELKTWPVAVARADLATRPLPDTATKLVRVAKAEGAPVPSVWVAPRTAVGDRVVLYLHGGSYLFGSHVTHADTLARVALAAEARVFAPDYRLAPEDPYPAQLDDAILAYRWLIERIAPERVAVAGESAGGNLVVALLVALRDRGLPLPACAAPISAWLDLEATHPSMTTNAATDYGDREMLLAHARLFAGDLPLSDARVSPLFADLERLPPLFLQVGDAERLLDENVALADRVRAAGGTAEVDRIPGHPHAPVFFAAWSPEAQAGVDRLGAWIRRQTP
jgi:acetyl esterase/lipase